MGSELMEELPAGTVVEEKRKPTGGRHGDIGFSVAIIVATAAAIQALAVWLAKSRAHMRDEQRLSIKRSVSGELTIEYWTGSEIRISEPPDPAIVEALRIELTAALKAVAPTDPAG